MKARKEKIINVTKQINENQGKCIRSAIEVDSKGLSLSGCTMDELRERGLAHDKQEKLLAKLHSL